MKNVFKLIVSHNIDLREKWIFNDTDWAIYNLSLCFRENYRVVWCASQLPICSQILYLTFPLSPLYHKELHFLGFLFNWHLEILSQCGLGGELVECQRADREKPGHFPSLLIPWVETLAEDFFFFLPWFKLPLESPSCDPRHARQPCLGLTFIK